VWKVAREEAKHMARSIDELKQQVWAGRYVNRLLQI
jgi:hypothetical protein